jgi:hypothetical protein
VTLGERPTGDERGRPIEEWSDEELIAEYRHIKGELADDDAQARNIEEEMERRALSPDREDVIPDAAAPGRETDPSPDSRPTAPAAGEDTSG